MKGEHKYPHEFAAAVGAFVQANDCLAECEDETEAVGLPLMRTEFGGAVAAFRSGNELAVSYSGPAPFGVEVESLFAAVAETLAAARRHRVIIDTLRFVATFTDEADDAEGADE